MRYCGKLLGLILGLMSGTGLWGVLLGLVVGYMVDKVGGVSSRSFFTNKRTRQSIFFHITFQVMGHLTKSKGRVTEMDIELASQWMDRMQLYGAARAAVQQAFSEGKQTEFPLREKLKELRCLCFGRFDLTKTFMEIQFQVAFADGTLHPNEWQVLNVIAEELGVSRSQFEKFISTMEKGYQVGDDGTSTRENYSSGGYQHAAAGERGLTEAYQVLGVSRSGDYMTIKRAYRKLMNEHHPDKLVAKKGFSAEMMEQTKQKAQEIQAAYDLIKREKGLK